MAVLVSINRQKAFLRRGEWVCADSRMEQRLNVTTADWFRETGGPPLQSIDLERCVAEEVVRRLGGRVLLHTAAPAKITRRLYLSKRQLELDFQVGES